MSSCVVLKNISPRRFVCWFQLFLRVRKIYNIYNRHYSRCPLGGDNRIFMQYTIQNNLVLETVTVQRNNNC
jgi:hypothetical protein